MQKLFIVVFTLLVFSALDFNCSFAYEKEIKSISSTITENIAKSGKKTIAVVDFTDLQGNVTELGRFLAEELSVDLTMTAQGFSVIDRTHLKSILNEHKLSISGLVDPKTVKQLGKIAGVDAIITGSVTPFGDSVRLSAKVIATDTAMVIGAAKGDIAKTKAIEELLSRGIGTGQIVNKEIVKNTTYTNDLKSKKVDDLLITMKGVVVSSTKEVRVILDVLNQYDEPFKMSSMYYPAPSLTDEKGSEFHYDNSDLKLGVILNPKSTSNIVLRFRPRNINDIREIGFRFSLNLPYLLYSTDRSKREYSVSFTDIEAQKPK